ncbi:DeoR/GlpR family DNA-binding transcription regulator [Streptomyces tsukubensis]|uniref:Lactose phosphotransferase system repressor n=1 Tax=Streptomyces tsukubensis TaxID=83656 RepID=A0A1V4AGP9_9ACTN|nr:DeoR/GlpR family DNA-binding transcription regulator [Streptomyces tsukubensis]OON82858.1 DeoR family transcriptional regulator [Streptomyces tsukubensis]QFR91965.1 DeoR family transcriptional regulator [Streptomyces tsukubensis]
MLPTERHRRISTAVERSGTISTEELAERLAVSAETVRRDLAQMERQGLLVRVRGGAATSAAVPGLSGEEAPFTERSASSPRAKTAIGRAAAELIRPGMTVVIDVGTTALQVARALPYEFRGTVVSPSLLVAAEISTRPHAEVLIPGGRLRSGDQVLSGALTVEFFTGLYADLAFLGSGGIDATAGVTDFHHEENATKRAILARAALCYVLADGDKYGRVAPHRVCGFADCAGLIADRAPDAALVEAVESAGGVVITA